MSQTVFVQCSCHSIATSMYCLSRRYANVLLGSPNNGTPAFRDIPVKAEISKSAWSEVAQNFARHHFQACTQDHAMCRLEKTLLPTRVVDLGTVGDSRLRLLETHGSRFGQYAALSYCWGGDQLLKTTFGNIDYMTSGRLLLSDLPQTLADAVHVTRSLGLQYLWVDALCIIQDNIEDWERESEQMSTIYENASLVISASSSSAATQGFLSHQRDNFQHQFTIPESYGTPGTIAIRADPCSGLHDYENKKDPLAKRAWAFQEQHMSTRCLLFSAEEMQWVCKEEAACECGNTTDSPSHHPSPLTYCNGKPHGDMATTELMLQARRAWREVVGDYSSRKLTRADDKLPAISGIASRLAAKSGLRYVAGLWKENIIHELAWMRGDQDPAPVPPDYVAPSFSWASIDSKVWYLFEGDEWEWVPFSTICDADSVVVGRNPYGRVSDAWLTVQAPVVRGFLRLDDTIISMPRVHFRSYDGLLDIYMRLDSAIAGFSYATEENELEASVQRYKLPQWSVEHEWERPDDDGPFYPARSGRASERTKSSIQQAAVWLLHLARETTSGVEGRESQDFFLVLGKSPRDPQKYERIGSCRQYTSDLLQELNLSSLTTQTITIL